MTSLQYTGIGGKRSSGYGQFDLTILDLPDSLKNRLTKAHQGPVMTLTTSLPVEKELEYAMETGSYLLSKSSGLLLVQKLMKITVSRIYISLLLDLLSLKPLQDRL